MSTSLSYWTLRNKYSPPLFRPWPTEHVTADAAQLAGQHDDQHEEQPAPEGTQGAPQEPQTEESQMSHHKKRAT